MQIAFQNNNKKNWRAKPPGHNRFKIKENYKRQKGGFQKTKVSVLQEDMNVSKPYAVRPDCDYHTNTGDPGCSLQQLSSGFHSVIRKTGAHHAWTLGFFKSLKGSLDKNTKFMFCICFSSTTPFSVLKAERYSV